MPTNGAYSAEVENPPPVEPVVSLHITAPLSALRGMRTVLGEATGDDFPWQLYDVIADALEPYEGRSA